MANLPVLHQHYDDPPQICRASINLGMNPDVSKLKKRKFFTEDAEESTLPAAKHKCFEAAIDLEEDLLITTDAENVSSDMDVLDTQVDSAEDSNSFTADSRLFAELKFNADSGKIDSCNEASTSRSNSASATSLNSSFYSEIKIPSVAGDGKEDMILTGGEKYSSLGVGWDDTDFLNECMSAEHFKGSKQQGTEGLKEFLSCSGMNSNLYILSSERWSADQEAQLRRKPTIDQEFEQYFSTLML